MRTRAESAAGPTPPPRSTPIEIALVGVEACPTAAPAARISSPVRRSRRRCKPLRRGGEYRQACEKSARWRYWSRRNPGVCTKWRPSAAAGRRRDFARPAPAVPPARGTKNGREGRPSAVEGIAVARHHGPGPHACASARYEHPPRRQIRGRRDAARRRGCLLDQETEPRLVTRLQRRPVGSVPGAWREKRIARRQVVVERGGARTQQQPAEGRAAPRRGGRTATPSATRLRRAQLNLRAAVLPQRAEHRRVGPFAAPKPGKTIHHDRPPAELGARPAPTPRRRGPRNSLGASSPPTGRHVDGAMSQNLARAVGEGLGGATSGRGTGSGGRSRRRFAR